MDAAGPSYDDQFDGSSLDTDRWNAIVRDDPADTTWRGGKLTTHDVRPATSTPATRTRRRTTSSSSRRDHAGEDWVIETKIDGATINGGYGQGGLMAHVDGDNYVKFDAISDVDNTAHQPARAALGGGGAIQSPQPGRPAVAAGVTEIWLRLTKAGDDLHGRVLVRRRRRGAAFPGTVTNPMAAPGLRPVRVRRRRPHGQGDLVPFEYFTLDGEDPPECDAVLAGDEFDGTALDKTKWNAIVHDDATKYARRRRRADGHDRRRRDLPGATGGEDAAPADAPTTPAPTG